jgi:hypothetical protein
MIPSLCQFALDMSDFISSEQGKKNKKLGTHIHKWTQNPFIPGIENSDSGSVGSWTVCRFLAEEAYQ